MLVQYDETTEIRIEYLRNPLTKLTQEFLSVFDGLRFRVEILLAQQVNHNQCQCLRA